ncbi:MAG: hypothetical protein KatS3mg105_0605 [Gemmatales bacterium]|nr:MAG: hypothetical protein KatS3mg105_0605 [Gemmatales bacterium]
MPSPLYARFAHVGARRVFSHRGDHRLASARWLATSPSRLGTSRPNLARRPPREQPPLAAEFVLLSELLKEQRRMKIELRKLADIKPYENNPRQQR